MNLMNIEQNAENLRLLGLIVAQRGETIYQHNWDSPCRRLLFSASKSFTGAAVGFAVQEGLLRLDDRLIELFPDEAPENPSENLCRATIRDALTMCIGQSRGYLMGAQRVGMAEEDWAKAVLALPFDEAPGTHFVYSNVGPYLAGLAVQKRAGCERQQAGRKRGRRLRLPVLARKVRFVPRGRAVWAVQRHPAGAGGGHHLHGGKPESEAAAGNALGCHRTTIITGRTPACTRPICSP